VVRFTFWNHQAFFIYRPRGSGMAKINFTEATTEAFPAAYNLSLRAFSRAQLSNWYLLPAYSLLFDCGEGFATWLGQEIYKFDKLFISHYHQDHIMGLLTLLYARESSMGANEKPVTVYYPEHSNTVESYRNYILSIKRWNTFPLVWVPVGLGFTLELSPEKARVPVFVEAFENIHTRHELSLGFRIVEHRTRLKPEIQKLGQEKIREIMLSPDRDRSLETYAYAKFLYSGDSMPVDRALMENAELVIHDCTFLKAEDREEPIHASAEELLPHLAAAGVKNVILTHFSQRYRSGDICQYFREYQQKTPIAFPLAYIWRNYLIDPFKDIRINLLK
jgi:ribonuclease Z